jgi:hypothetical protein
MKYIYETAIYDGRWKHWRILNLNTLSAYSTEFESEDAALAAIEDGQKRAGKIVKRVRARDLIGFFDHAQQGPELTGDQLFYECVRLGADAGAVAGWPDFKRREYVRDHTPSAYGGLTNIELAS